MRDSIMLMHLLIIGLLASGWSAAIVSAAEPAGASVSFRRDLAPVLRDQCLACHSAKKTEGGYRVDTFTMLLKPGDSGDTPVTAGKPDESELLRRLESDDESERMPYESDPLPADFVKLVRRWIAQGARYDGGDPNAPIVTIVAPGTHPPPPETYARPLPVAAMAWIRQGDRWLLATGGYRELLLWDPEKAVLVRRVRNLPSRIHSMAVDAKRNRLAVAGGEPGRLGEVRIVDTGSWEVLAVPWVRGDVVLSVAVDEVHGRWAAAASDGYVAVVNGEDSRVLWSVEVHKEWVKQIAWSPQGDRIATAGFDGQAIVVSAKDGKIEQVFAEHKQPVWGISFLPDGKQIVSADESARAFFWSVSDGKKQAEVRVGGGVFAFVAGDGGFFAGARSGRVVKLDGKTRKESGRWSGPKGRVVSLAWEPSKQWLAAGTDLGEIWVWRLKEKNQTWHWTHRVTAKPRPQP